MQQIKQYIIGLDADKVMLVSSILALIIAIALGLIVYNLAMAGIESDLYNRIRISSKDYIKELLFNSENSRYNYFEIEKKLLSYGYTYYFKSMDPHMYMTYKFVLSGVCAIFGTVLAGFAGLIIGLPLGYFIIDIYVRYMNKKDNNEMLGDIRLMLGSIKIQNKASIHIVSSLNECYYLVSNKRLKKALLEFSGDINAKVEIDTALDNLCNKFNSKHMGSFCSAIKQSVKTGVISDISESIGTQMVNIQKVMMIKERHIAERDKNIATALVFIIVTAFIFISTVYSLDFNLF